MFGWRLTSEKPGEIRDGNVFSRSSLARGIARLPSTRAKSWRRTWSAGCFAEASRGYAVGSAARAAHDGALLRALTRIFVQAINGFYVERVGGRSERALKSGAVTVVQRTPLQTPMPGYTPEG